MPAKYTLSQSVTDHSKTEAFGGNIKWYWDQGDPDADPIFSPPEAVQIIQYDFEDRKFTIIAH